MVLYFLPLSNWEQASIPTYFLPMCDQIQPVQLGNRPYLLKQKYMVCYLLGKALSLPESYLSLGKWGLQV